MKRLLSIGNLEKIQSKPGFDFDLFYPFNLIALIASIKFDLGIFKFHLAEMEYSISFYLAFNTYIAAVLKLFLAIVIVSMMANRYSYGTTETKLIDGMSKEDLFNLSF
jgi:hypothetical protein